MQALSGSILRDRNNMCQDQGWLKSTLDISWLIACVHICSLSNLPFLAGKSPIFRYSITIMAMTSPSSGLSSWQSQATETTRTQPGVEWTSLVNSARLNMAEHDPQRSPFRPEIHIPGSWNQVAPPCWNAPGWVKEDLLARTLAYLGMACNGPTTISRTETTNGSDHMSTKHEGHPGATLAKLHHLHRSPEHGTWPALRHCGHHGPSRQDLPPSRCFENDQLYFKGWMMMDESDQIHGDPFAVGLQLKIIHVINWR